MSPYLFRRLSTLSSFAVAMLILNGCGQDHDHSHSGASSYGHGHGHGDDSPSGASFKHGKGVSLTDETRDILGIRTADVEERTLPIELHFNLQLFEGNHLPNAATAEQSRCVANASGMLTAAAATHVALNQSVRLQNKSGVSFEGTVKRLHPLPVMDETEIIVCVTNTGTECKAGEFLTGQITIPRETPVMTVPGTAVLRTAEGAFVYAVNGDAYFRTSVKTGTESRGHAEITDGLFAGDQVVTNGVQALWLIELRETKGGGHSH